MGFSPRFGYQISRGIYIYIYICNMANGYDMIWFDMIIWYDMIWYDMIWYDMIWYDICQVLLPWCLFLLCKCNCLCLLTHKCFSLMIYCVLPIHFTCTKIFQSPWGHPEKSWDFEVIVKGHETTSLWPFPTKVITGYRWPLTLPPTGLSKDGDLINILVMSSNRPVWICMVWLEDNILYLKPPTHQLGCQMLPGFRKTCSLYCLQVPGASEIPPIR